MGKMKEKSPSGAIEPSRFIDSLNLSDPAKQLDALKAHIFTALETNQTKIEIIKEELNAGRYEIHSDRIADRLLEHALIVVTQEPELA